MSRTEQQLKLSSVELMKISRLKSVDQKAESSTKVTLVVLRVHRFTSLNVNSAGL